MSNVVGIYSHLALNDYNPPDTLIAEHAPALREAAGAEPTHTAFLRCGASLKLLPDRVPHGVQANMRQ